MWSSFVSKFVFGLIRHALTFGGGWLQAHAQFTSDDANAIVGALMTIIGIVWSWSNKRKQVRTEKDLEIQKAIPVE